MTVASLTNGCLVPYMEAVIRDLQAAVANARKGTARSLISATKRWFGSGSSSSSSTPASATNSTSSSSLNSAAGKVAASPSRGSVTLTMTTEAQTRKLADFAFMLQCYDLASKNYDSLRRDFNNDKAWKHYAGALVSSFAAAVVVVVIVVVLMFIFLNQEKGFVDWDLRIYSFIYFHLFIFIYL